MNRLDFGTIFKRSSCLNSTESKIDSEKIFKRLDNFDLESIRENYLPISYSKILNEYINSLSNKENASQNWYNCLKILENLNDHNLNKDAKYFTDNFISRVLPYVENMEGVLESLNRYDLRDYQYESITNICEQFKLADKIVNNHNQISKRFNIEYEVKSAKIKGLDKVIETCCSMIDTYSYEPYQKMNMSIEETAYLLEKNNIDYRPDVLITSILEYFLLRSSKLSDRDIKGYKYVMEHNKCIDDVSASRFLFEDFDVINIKSAINDYLKIQNKTPEITESKFIDIINNTSIDDLKNNNHILLNFLYKLYSSQVSQENDTNKMLDSIIKILFALIDRYNNEAMNNNITRDDVIKLIANFERLKASININSNIVDDEFVVGRLEFKNLLGNIINDKLNDLSNSIYSKDNVESIEYVNSDEAEEVPLKEYKIFKYNNITKATTNLDKYFKNKIRNFMQDKKVYLGFNDIKPIMFNESNRIKDDSIFNFIGTDNKVDVCCYQIGLKSESDIKESLDELSTICKEFNNELNINNIDGIRSYYTINGCIAEIHIKDSTKISLTEEEQHFSETFYKPELDVYINQLALFEACNEIAENFEDKTLDETIVSIFDKDIDMSLEAYDVAMDALSLIGANKNQIDMFTESFSNYRNSILIENAEIISENKFIKSIYNNWEPVEDAPYDIQVEAYKIFNDIIQEAAPKVSKPKVGGANVKNNQNKTQDKNKNEDNYAPSQNISNKLNNMKIYLQGLKSKAKDMGQKERELSRQLDSTFNNFSKSVKNALISDRRESIIKGSVIPSFSKSIKICLGLVTLGVIAHNPIVPLIAAIGGLAASKKLTKKERILLLDEIEIELDVVEKEIANADSRNQIKKYRALLKYKKDLQRQYQRIKYNVRVGKDILPGSAAGFKDRYN